MDRDAAIDLIDNTESMPEHKRNGIFKGMCLLSGVVGPEGDVDPKAGHDQIWCCDFAETVALMREDQVRLMARWGWFESEDAWSHWA